MSNLQATCEPMQSIEVERCTALMIAAELELSCFMRAVHNRYDAAAAQVAGAYWVAELESMEEFSRERTPDWRPITLRAIRKLRSERRLDRFLTDW